MMAIRVITINTYMVRVIGGIVHISAKQTPIYLTIKNLVRILVSLLKLRLSK